MAVKQMQLLILIQIKLNSIPSILEVSMAINFQGQLQHNLGAYLYNGCKKTTIIYFDTN